MIHLHVHDAKGSLLDSILTVEQSVKFAKENNYKAIACTNHGAMYSYVDFYKECMKQSVKPIIGNEVYEVDDMTFKNDTKGNKQRRYHLILLARNQEGLQNLYKITSDSFTLGFYTKPRIDLDYIEKNNLGKGIICLTACQAGRVSRYLVEGKEHEALNYVKRLRKIFDYTALEIQAHDTESEINSNTKILKLAFDNNLPFVVTTDAHMLEKKQQNTHEVFVEIGEGREVGELYTDCYLQTTEEVHEKLDKYFGESIVSRAIEETYHIADMVEVVDIGLKNTNQMPKTKIPKVYRNSKEYFKYLVYKDFETKFAHYDDYEKERRRQRIEQEIPILEALDYIDYFIMLYEVMKRAKARKIPLGLGRGSACGTLCAYMMNITQVDSVKWGLDFSRFANLGRKSMADIDLDISKLRRREIIEISKELFGESNVAPMATFNSLSTKVAIRDIGKVLHNKGVYDLPYKLRDEVSKMIPTIKTISDLGEEEEKETLLRDVLFKNEELKAVAEKYPLWFKYVLELEGLPKSLGRHASGTLITPKPIYSYLPLCLDSDGNAMTQLEMHNAMDDLKLIKMDYLGLNSLDIIDEALNLAGLDWDTVNVDKLNLDDKHIFNEIYKDGNTINVFQMESAEAIRMCMEAEVDNIEDVIAINAFNRPATKDFFPTYCQNKRNPHEVKVEHEDLLQIFGKTYFVLLYQEQALQLFRHAGFPEDEVDNARRAIGKKEKATMKELSTKFIKGLLEKGWTEAQAKNVWLMLEKQATYSFNRSHSVAYGLTSYIMAWLKYYYPTEFMTACMNANSDNTVKISISINECRRMNIEVLPPHINKSNEGFTAIPKKRQILFGILPVKGIGESVTQAILSHRPFKNLKDFLDRAKTIPELDKGAVVALIKAGAIPTKNKRRTLLQYFESTYEKPEYKPYKGVKSLPTLFELETVWNIDPKKVTSKDERLRLFNEKREREHNTTKRKQWEDAQKVKFEKSKKEFEEKYMQEEYLWEFETLSMFLTNNPFEGAYEKITGFHRTNNGDKCVCICVIIDVKRKKDKNGNAFAYLDLFTPHGIIESICWSSKYSKYQGLIKKGSNIAILGRKDEEKLFIEEIKSYQKWQDDNGFDFVTA